MRHIVRHKVVLGLILSISTLAAARVVAAQMRPASASDLLHQGRFALDRGEWDRAGQCVERLEQLGHAAYQHLLRGEMLLRGGRQRFAARPEEARKSFRLALDELTQIRDGPPSEEVAVLAAECLVRLDEPRLAASALNAVVSAHPEQCEAHRWLAAIYIDLNAPADAIRHLEAWGRLDESTGRPYRWIGFFQKGYNRVGPAVEAYRTALRRQLEPSLRADVIKELADVLLEDQGDYQAALEVLADCPEPYRNKPEFLTLRAEGLWGLGRTTEAAAAVDEALRMPPATLPALRLRGKFFLAEGRTTAARPLLESVLSRDPHDHAARQLLMQVCSREGNSEEAEHQRQLLEQTRGVLARLTELHHEARDKPWDAEVRWRIVKLCQQLNRTDEARMWARAAEACGPGGAAADDSLSPLTGR
jgi:tetratricopeptide (TPR) repeat protein